MKELFLILFFSQTVLLTPEPVDLDGIMKLTPEKPLEAITHGASLQIDVSSMIAWREKENILSFRSRLTALFPPGSIEAELIGKDNESILLHYEGEHQFNRNSVMLSLYADDRVPTNLEFKQVILKSYIELKGVQVYWKNYKH